MVDTDNPAYDLAGVNLMPLTSLALLALVWSRGPETHSAPALAKRHPPA